MEKIEYINGALRGYVSGDVIDIDNTSLKCYNDSNNKRDSEGNAGMSFSGIIIKGNKAIGFADSKVSSNRSDGYIQDVQKPYMQKIFMTESFIITFVGASGFLYYEDGVARAVYIDEIVRKYLDNSENPVSLCSNVFSFLREKEICLKGKIHACAIVMKKNTKTIHYKITLSETDMHVEADYPPNLILYTNGDTRYSNYVMDRLVSFCNKNENELVAELDKLPDIIEGMEGYQVCGGPWVTKTLTLD